MNILQSMELTEKDLIISILRSFYILDYGYINKVNPDKTVNVTHATKTIMLDGTELAETTTDNVEVLTISGGGFSLKWDYKAKDKVLLLGLKDYIQNVDDVTKAEPPKAFMHYSRNTIKCIPLCIFNEEAKVNVIVDNGKMTINAKDKIELNGNSKQLVTWAELNSALSSFLTQLTTALTTTPIAGNGAPQPTWTGLPTSIDISSAKSQKIVTG